MKTHKMHLITCAVITFAITIFMGVVYSLIEAEREVIMFEAFQHGCAVPVKHNSGKISYEWISPQPSIEDLPPLKINEHIQSP
jgi:hypothetical protein